MRKIVMLVTVAVLMLLMAPGTSLADANGWYIGASAGRSTIDIGIIPDDPTAVGYKIFGGYRFGALALEGGYVDFGDTSDDYLGLPLDIDVTGLDILGVINLPLGPVKLFGKVGMFAWDYKLDSAAGDDSDEGADSVVGFGGAIGVGPVGLRAEVEIFNVEPVEQIIFFTLGATYAF